MADPARQTTRSFKTQWFAKAAGKAGIDDGELCRAIKQVINGQGDDLGGGVFKKRLNRNMHRCIILGKGRGYWIYAYLFAKKDRDNIEDTELKDFRKLAKIYEALSSKQLARLLKDRDLMEICHDDKAQV
jgi:hypothetical protein